MKDFYFEHDLYYDKLQSSSSTKEKPKTVVFYEQVSTIYESFSKLNQQQIDQFEQWYKANNNIEKVCSNDPNVKIIRYADIASLHPELNKHLQSFFKTLYSFNPKALKKKIGDIETHYNAFMSANKTRTMLMCPFCGLSAMRGDTISGREAYDHYLPKSIYPFNSINFRNLVPTCGTCNSKEKNVKDPAFTAKDTAGKSYRRKSFYPYNPGKYNIEITVELKSLAADGHFNFDDVELTFGPSTISEEIESWKHLYGIEERYKQKYCDGGSAKYWLEEARRTCHEMHIDIERIIAMYSRSPIPDNNFLRVPFLEACHRIGLFENSPVTND